MVRHQMPETMENATAPTPAAAPRTDRLELVKEMARGSIGVVHKAKNAQSNRVIALRQFEVPEWLDDVEELLKRILAEARSASSLDHPNIAKLHTCGYKGFTVFMTSEFVEGKTLKEVMEERQPELGEILSIAKQLCAALDYAQEKSVVHHFLNPSNIKLRKDGTLKVLDFGLVKEKNLLSQTPAKKLENEPYLSPEEVKNKPVTAAGNLFTAAAILYQLYTGRSPFAGKHLGEVDRAITDVEPHPLNMAHPRVPHAISAVILKALSKSAAERYKSGKQLVLALEDAMKGVPPAALAPKPAAAPKPAPASASGVESVNYSGGYAPVPAKPAPAPAPAPAASTTRMHPATPPPAPKVQVGSATHWKLVGGVVACLVIVAVVAALFQRKPKEIPENVEPQAVAPKPAPVPAPAPVVAESEPSPAVEVSSVPVVSSKRGKPVRAPRVVKATTPSAPQEGEVFISSVPADAVIEIEGFRGQVWKTPQAIGALQPGTYKVTVSKPGYATDVRNVQVSAGNRVGVDVRLTAVKGWVNVSGSPAGANIFVDGRDSGKLTPATLILDPATHNITLRKAGYLDAGGDLQLAAGQTTSYSPTLMVAGRTDNIKIVGGGMGVGKIFGGNSGQGRARIEIKSEPKGAQVIINGTPLQKTTPVEIQVEAGNYDITIQKDGYQTVRESAIVGIDDHVRISKALAR
ncbi:MAG TPA: serine/threonine-protein kinase [Candidatus Angelobacter sp.]|nr:serine/threonine-protein kinase [Candidatus Angelobacter sp.]